MNNIKLIAHRGGYKESNTKENSIDAIKYSISKDYIDGVEFDVRVTKDHKIVLIHNSSIKYHNKRYKISETDYNDLNKMYLETFNIKLNTLDEILTIIPRNKLIFLEIKNMNSKYEKENLNIIYNTIRRYITKKIVIISFLYKYLKYFNFRGYDTCFLLNRNSRFFELKTYFKLYLTLNLNIISMDKRMIKKKTSNRILKSNKSFGIYTIDNAKEVDQLFNEIGIEVVREYQDKIYITTTNPRIVKERILLYEKN